MQEVLDSHFVRSQFPAFADPMANDWVFFDNAAATYVASSVIQKMNQYMVSTRVQPYYRHAASQLAGNAIDETFRLFAELINAQPDEIIFNASTSMNNYILANAFSSSLQEGDEIIVTNQDHESNIGFWRRIAENKPGIIIKEWSISPDTGLLNNNELKKLLTQKTKLVCVTHCSNVIGAINDVKTIAMLAHNVGAMILVDGVAFAPHGAIDVKDLDVDFYVYSLYKTYGPHIGLLYAKKEHLINLANQGHACNSQFLRKKWTPGGPQYAEIAYAAGIIDYYRAFYEQHFTSSKDVNLCELSKCIHERFQQQEASLAKPILDYLNATSKVRILGAREMILHKRAPTISFVCQEKTSQSIVDQLLSYKVAVTNSHFYAQRLLTALGVNDLSDGAVRISLVHYNTSSEVGRFLDALGNALK